MKTFDDLLEEICNMVGGIHESRKGECTIRFRLDVGTDYKKWQCKAVEFAESEPNGSLADAVTLLHRKLSGSIQEKIKLAISQFPTAQRDAVIATIPQIPTLTDVDETDIGFCENGLLRIAAIRGEKDDSGSRNHDDWIIENTGGNEIETVQKSLKYVAGEGARMYAFSMHRMTATPYGDAEMPETRRWGVDGRIKGAGAKTVREAIQKLNDKLDIETMAYVERLIAGLPRRANE